MGKNQYTELDKLFRSKLGEENLSSGDWNEPTDDMFLAAMESVNKQDELPRKKKRAIWPFFLIPFIALLSISIWNLMEVGALKSTINNMQSNDQMIGANESNADTEIASIATGNEQKENQEIASTKIAGAKSQFKNAKAKATKKSTIAEPIVLNENNKEIKKTGSAPVSGPSIVPPSNNESFLPVSNGASIFNNAIPISGAANTDLSKSYGANNQGTTINKLLGFSFIPQLGGLLNITERNAIELGINPTAFKAAEDKSKKRAIALYAFLDLNLNTLRMSGLESNEFSLTAYDNSYLGYNLGIGALQELNERFAINYSIAYNRVTNKSLYENEMMFDKNQLSYDMQGDMWYALDMEVETPTGSFTLREDVSMTNPSMEHNDMMNQSTDILQLFNFISIGVQPRVNVLTSSKFNLFAEAGMNANYLLHFCQNIDMKMYHDDDMMMAKAMIDDSNATLNTLNRLSMSASLGLGVEYKFGEHIFSSFKVGGSRSLSSIRQHTNSTDQVRTYIDNLGVSLTAGYKF